MKKRRNMKAAVLAMALLMSAPSLLPAAAADTAPAQTEAAGTVRENETAGATQTEAQQQTEAAPQTEAQQQTEAAPQTEAQQQTEAAPQTEAQQQTEAAPQTEAQQQTEAAPQTEARQQTEAAPQTEAQQLPPGVLAGVLKKNLRRSGVDVTGSWKKTKAGWSFILPDGSPAIGWLRTGPYTYYLDKKGVRVRGLQKIGKRYYYFARNGRQKTGCIKLKGVVWEFDPLQNGARTSRVKVVNGVPNTAPDNLKKADPDNDPTRVHETLRCSFGEDGTFYDRKGYAIEKSTLKNLLKTAIQPVGKTMYIWGGGWAPRAEGSGNAGSVEASSIGVSSRWKEFFKKAGKGYNYRSYRFYTHLGLDCSGYVGWTLYNTFNSQSGHGDYVMLAQNMARTYAGWGWGSYTPAGTFTDHRPGDIMSLGSGHVYIVIGACKDGSIVLVHSSPRGVMITGTSTRAGSKKSQANRLATRYMKKYFKKWYRKFPDSSRNASYLTRYARMRWKLTGKDRVMSDPEGYADMGAEEVLKDLFGKA